MRAPRQRLSASRRTNRRPLGARDASQACAGVDAGRPCSIQAIETVRGLRTQGSLGVEPGTLSTLPAAGVLARCGLLPNPVNELLVRCVVATKRVRRRKRRSWSKAGVRELRAHSRSKSPVKKIATAMKRTAGALRQKAFSLGLPLGHRR